MMINHSNLTLIGVGNIYRSDDGVGIAVVHRLQTRVPGGVAILEVSGEGTSLLDAWEGATSVILVDAVRSGAPPGTIHRFDAIAEQLPRGFFGFSTHTFGMVEAIELARKLNQLPFRLRVYGIEGEKFTMGMKLSASVEQAAAVVAHQVLEELRSFPTCPT